MNAREAELLLRSVQSIYPIPKETIPTVSELSTIIKKIPTSNFDPKDKKLGSILTSAARNDHQEIVVALLDAKVNPNISDEKEEHALQAAAFSGRLQILRLLLDKKATIDTINSKGFTALMCGVAAKNLATVQFLLDAKANPNLRTEHFSPLGHSIMTKQPDIIVNLLKAGAKADDQKSPELDNLIYNYSPDLDGDLREGMTHKEIEKALLAINLLLNQNALLKFPLGLYNYLRVCNQRNPLVKDSFRKLCEYIEKHPATENNERVRNEKSVLQPAQLYLKKLQVVMQYQAKEIPEPIPSAPWAKDYDHIAWSRSYQTNFNAKEVEKLYDLICQQKHPFWFTLKPLGVSVDVEPKDICDSKPMI